MIPGQGHNPIILQGTHRLSPVSIIYAITRRMNSDSNKVDRSISFKSQKE